MASTLFLDRDGVINRELRGDYVKQPSEFEYEEGVFTALRDLAPHFKYILIVTNQRGVGAGLMTQKDLDHIHTLMTGELAVHGIRIDAIYAATDADRSSLRRKPHPTMGHEAARDFPDIDFKQSVMVGNSGSDMAFGHSLGMYCVFINDKGLYSQATEVEFADVMYDSLKAYAGDCIRKGSVFTGREFPAAQ